MTSLDGNGTASETVPHVVIVGGGFGGLNAARALRHAAVRVTLIDRQNSQLFRPMLYQVATGILPASDIALYIELQGKLTLYASPPAFCRRATSPLRSARCC